MSVEFYSGSNIEKDHTNHVGLWYKPIDDFAELIVAWVVRYKDRIFSWTITIPLVILQLKLPSIFRPLGRFILHCRGARIYGEYPLFFKALISMKKFAISFSVL